MHPVDQRVERTYQQDGIACLFAPLAEGVDRWIIIKAQGGQIQQRQDDGGRGVQQDISAGHILFPEQQDQ
ncbi:hypothetical protein [Parabacteroides gordonii]|uniref:hypothetical protein n=1 Tax=Parabacteroides gordonii TaxID=574930 RepID=UPI0026ECBD0D|nr:hypothetical protein [Parabacteroides gordonii]